MTMRAVELVRRLTALTLLLSTLLITMPVSAAELAARTTLGSVSGSGSVTLRGVSVLQEGTIFDGDVLEVGMKSYARVILIAGHRFELGADTQISIHQTD